MALKDYLRLWFYQNRLHRYFPNKIHIAATTTWQWKLRVDNQSFLGHRELDVWEMAYHEMIPSRKEVRRAQENDSRTLTNYRNSPREKVVQIAQAQIEETGRETSRQAYLETRRSYIRLHT